MTIPPGRAALHHGDCYDILKLVPDNTYDAIVTDPPYGMSDHDTGDIKSALKAWLSGEVYKPKLKGFLGRSWDAFVPGPEIWKECNRVLKPGGHLLAFASTRTQDLMGLAIRLADFEIRDSIAWLHGQGMPKGLNVGKSFDKQEGNTRVQYQVKNGVDTRGVKNVGNAGILCALCGETTVGSAGLICGHPKDSGPVGDLAKQWEGWNTTLKPGFEPIIVAQKPYPGTVIENIRAKGVGAFNIGACRVGPVGRWPANAILQHSDDCGSVCVEGCPILEVENQSGITTSGASKTEVPGYEGTSNTGFLRGRSGPSNQYGDTGTASRFFYTTKATKAERTAGGKVENTHVTVKALALMRYLCRLVTPPGGVVLDPFMGSGSTGVAALQEGFDFVGIEKDEGSYCTAKGRISFALAPELWVDQDVGETEIPGDDTKEMTLEDLLGFGGGG